MKKSFFKLFQFFSHPKNPPINKYEKYIKKCSRKKLHDIIENYSTTHGRLIIKYLIEFATEHKLPIYMVSNSLYAEFWNPLTDSLNTYFQENEKSSFNLIVLDLPKIDLPNNIFYSLLKSDDLLSSVKIYDGADATIYSNPIQFFLVGENAYRMERYDNRSVYRSSFNDLSNGIKLLNDFNSKNTRIIL